MANYPTEYITKSEYGHLIGKRARFKKNLSTYTTSAHGRTGTIGQHEGVEHVGLSLFFDKPIRAGYKGSMKTESLYIMPNSITMIRTKKGRK
jgi:hypothetical protein